MPEVLQFNVLSELMTAAQSGGVAGLHCPHSTTIKLMMQILQRIDKPQARAMPLHGAACVVTALPCAGNMIVSVKSAWQCLRVLAANATCSMFVSVLLWLLSCSRLQLEADAAGDSI